jgi:hypothetical protein
VDFRQCWFDAPQVRLHYAEARADGPPLVMLQADPLGPFLNTNLIF